MPIQPGSRLGPYEVGELLGRGAMGVVYRAVHTGLDREAAVKVMQALAPSPTASERFHREAKAIARLRHPNILAVYDYGEADGLPYMIFEYLAGGTLADRIAGGRVSDRDALRLLEGIAAGLDYAHELNLVHRDVKPTNVLLGHRDLPVLADFGLVKLLEETAMTASGATTGTPQYMAPEQVGGPGSETVGPAAARYALAAVAYELLTGHLPFEAEGLMKLLYAKLHTDPPPASSHRPHLSPEVDAVLARGLARDPAERWESSADFVNALREALTVPAPAPPPAPAVAPNIDQPVFSGLQITNTGNWTDGVSQVTFHPASIDLVVLTDVTAGSSDPFAGQDQGATLKWNNVVSSCCQSVETSGRYVADWRLTYEGSATFQWTFTLGSCCSMLLDTGKKIIRVLGPQGDMVPAANVSGIQAGQVITLAISADPPHYTVYIGDTKAADLTDPTNTSNTGFVFFVYGHVGTMHLTEFRVYNQPGS